MAMHMSLFKMHEKLYSYPITLEGEKDFCKIY